MSSNFENLPLPVTKDSQDYVRLIPAGQTVEIPVVGDFIYCKFSDGEIRVVINGKSTNMESGDERRSGDGTVFRGVNLINDTGVDKYVVFVIGFGKFDRKIVQGNISIEPVLRSADGTLKADTRYDVIIDLTPVTQYGGTFASGFRFAQSNPGNDWESVECACWGPGDTIVQLHLKQGPDYALSISDQDLNLISIGAVPWPGNSNAGSLGWTQAGGFFGSVPGENKLYGLTGGSPVLASFDDDVQSVAVDFDRASNVYVLCQNNVVYECNSSVEKTGKSYAVPSNLRFIVYDRKRKQFFGANPVQMYLFDKDFNVISTINYSETTINAVTLVDRQPVILGDLIWLPAPYRVDPITCDKYAFFDFTLLPDVKAIRPGCGLLNAKKKSTIKIQPQGVTFEPLGNKLAGTGTVIRALLEYYFQTSVEDDYLDHVYGLDLSMNANGTRFKPITSGNRTFLAESIADDFTFLIPNRAVIKIDSGLSTGSVLAVSGV
jgi:hypothetical protein